MIKYYGLDVPHLESLIQDLDVFKGENEVKVDEMLNDFDQLLQNYSRSASRCE